jgi:protein-S-isoprenylcysteine O-methyltransferase Ste14
MLSTSRHRETTKAVGLLLGRTVSIAAIFVIAGTLEWWNAWVFLAFITVLGWASSKAIGKSAGLVDERRAASSKARPWDLVVVRLLNLALPAMLVLAALNQRFTTLSPVSPTVSGAAFTGMAVAGAVTYHAIAVNPFFSSYIRVQEDRGHTVVAAGPYRFVRHPGYAGAVMFNLLVPLALGSWMAMPVGVCAALLLAYRTAKEDAILSTELPRYAVYAREVPSRLIPWVW